MKKIFLLLFGLIILGTLSAQENGSKIYVVHLKDKGVNTDASINPSLYLTDKAIERRIKHSISFDQSDIPVNEEYVKSISGSGARILTRSRWFNTLVIEATPEILVSVSSLPFVSRVKLLENKTQLLSEKDVKPYFKAESVNPWTKGFTKKATSDVYDYGAAYNQINQMHGQYLHNNGYSGQGMTIAVLDAGFNSVDVMPCFDSLRANNQIKGTTDIAQPGNNVYGNWMYTHGTSVLSCMGSYINGQMVGTAPKADYWLIRTEVAETESIIEEYYWVSGAEFADSVGADLINSSLGYTTFDDPSTNHTYADMDGNTTVVTIGADKAAEKGILVVNSAGNEGGSAWKYISAPADGDSVFTIGAVDFAGNRAGFSSVGPTYDGRIKPTVDAQGLNSAIFSPGGLGSGSGTSFSSPITCGITACLWQALPSYNNMQVIELMKATASQASAPDSLLGWGIPNVEKALTTLSVNTQSVKNTLFCYPNPINDNLTISFPNAIQGEYKIEIVNLQGQVVYSEPGNTTSLRSIQLNNLGNLAAGIYLVKVSNKGFSYLNKIVKK
jgi:hypothetical protein